MPPSLQRQIAPTDAASPKLDAAAVLAWYDRNARRLPWRVGPAERARGVRPDPYRVWLSEVMLQQTTVPAVGRYFARFTALWPDVTALAAAPIEAVLAEWAGLGYYARARNLHATARAVAERHGGTFPASAAELAELPGIGPYTAAAIAAIAHDERIAVLDGNVERVLARYLMLDVPPAEAKPHLRAFLQQAVPARAGDFAQGLMDLGATVCAPRAASCPLCPLAAGCAARASGNPLAYPVKAARTPRAPRFGHAYVMIDDAGRVFLRRRAETGLLAKMTEVPGSGWQATAMPPRFPAAAEWRPAGRVRHVFTHLELELSVWSARIAPEAAPSGGWWAAPHTLGAQGLPSVFRKVLAAAGIGASGGPGDPGRGHRASR